MDGTDMRVVEGGQELCLALEALETVGVLREDIGQDLEGDIAIEPGVTGAVHDAHAARPQGGLDFVRADAGAGGERHREEGPCGGRQIVPRPFGHSAFAISTLT